MALKRAAGGVGCLLRRLHGCGQLPAATALSNSLALGPNLHPSACSCASCTAAAFPLSGHLQYRAYADLAPHTATAVARTPDGLTAVEHALKNPTPDISYDEWQHERFAPGDPNKRAFTYMVLTGGRFIYASALRLAVLKLILSMTATKDVLAMASLEVDLSKIEPGQTITVKWRGKPVFVRRRTEADIEKAEAVDLKDLRDPEPDSARVKNPEWLVVIGVCTHLGCVPLPNAGDYQGWFCPCHGSHYDISGRVRKGPAPYNLEVPTYKFMDDSTLMVG